MKLLAFILSLYIALLSCLTCVDESVGETVIADTEIHATADNHDHQGDLCSPFCTCECCGVYFLNYYSTISFEFKPMSVVISKLVTEYKSVFFSGYIGSIWQPPQIA